jgi:cytochrome c-type biogenesis protein CcmH
VNRARRRLLAWIVMAAIAVAVFAFGALGHRGGASTNAVRIDQISREIRCKACPGESVFESRVPFAENVKAEIARQVAAGKTTGEIKAALVSEYGQDILLLPQGNGATSLLWVIPIIVLVTGAVGLGMAFRNWRDEASMVATDEDRAILERLRHHPDDPVDHEEDSSP